MGSSASANSPAAAGGGQWRLAGGGAKLSFAEGRPGGVDLHAGTVSGEGPYKSDYAAAAPMLGLWNNADV
jgi:hypothetical protein